MNMHHPYLDLFPLRSPTPEEIEASMRRAHVERSRVAHDLLVAAARRVAGWFNAAPRRRAPHGCPDPV